MYNFHPYNVLWAIATNIPQRLVLCSRDTHEWTHLSARWRRTAARRGRGLVRPPLDWRLPSGSSCRVWRAGKRSTCCSGPPGASGACTSVLRMTGELDYIHLISVTYNVHLRTQHTPTIFLNVWHKVLINCSQRKRRFKNRCSISTKIKALRFIISHWRKLIHLHCKTKL